MRAVGGEFESRLKGEANIAGLKVVDGEAAPAVMVGADLNQCARKLGEVVARLDLFELNGELVFIDHARERQVMDAHTFRTWINEHVILATGMNKEGEYKRTTLDVSDARSILQSQSFRAGVRRVEHFEEVRLPAIREDGTPELLPWGYDPETRIYTIPGGLEYDHEQDLAVGKGWLERWMGTMPMDDRSRAVQVAAMLAFYCRHMLQRGALRPGFLWLANKAGSGKSVLAKAVLYTVMGRAPSSKMKRGEELDKELEAFSRAASPFIFLDNVYGGIKSASIDQLLTSDETTGRAMGGHGVFTSRNTALLLVTGNRLELNEDAERRFLIVDLFETGDPAERVVDFRIDDKVMRTDEWRAATLSALWSMVRTWAEEGCKEGPTQLRTFETCTALLGGVVMAAGYADPIQKAELPDSVNPERQEFLELMGGVLEEMDEKKQHALDWTLEDLARVARAKEVFIDKVGTQEQGKRETIKQDGLKGEERQWAEDLGYLTASQRSAWSIRLKNEVGTEPVVGGRRVQFGQRAQSRKTRYTVQILS